MPSLGHFKRLAKDLVKAVRREDPAALARVRAEMTRPVDVATFQLAHAQFVLAREAGFPSWTQFKEDLELRLLELPALADQLLLALTDPVWHARARRIAARSDALATYNLATAAALGRPDRVRALLAKDPKAATTPMGPRNATPLVYCAFSRIDATPGILESAKLLLAAGADPNATLHDRGEDVALLYGAVAANNVQLVELLLASGATPDDDESLYHATEHRDHACLKALLKYKPRTKGTNALLRMLDFEDAVGLRLLLDAGADVNEAPAHAPSSGTRPLHHAIRRGRSPVILGLLLDHRADIEARDDEACTPYALARRLGHDAAATFLASRGASNTSSPTDDFLHACARGDLAAAQKILSSTPDFLASLSPAALASLPEAAIRGDLAAVETLLAAGLPVDAPGLEMKMTALHSAAWWGNPAMVALLLRHGASVTVTNDYGGVALSNAVHGSIHCPRPQGDYAEVARLLLAAGSTPSEWMVDAGSDAVAAAIQTSLS